VTVAMARINQYRQAVVACFREAMPELRECSEQFGRFALDDLETTIVRAPAVRVATLSVKGKPQPNGQAEADLACAAFIITEGPQRDASAWTIAEAIFVLLDTGQMFGLTRLGTPSNISIVPVITGKLKSKAVSIIAVEWRQSLRELGAAIWDDEQHLLRELYVNDMPVDLGAGDA